MIRRIKFRLTRSKNAKKYVYIYDKKAATFAGSRFFIVLPSCCSWCDIFEKCALSRFLLITKSKLRHYEENLFMWLLPDHLFI